MLFKIRFQYYFKHDTISLWLTDTGKYLGRQVGPTRLNFILDGDRFHSGQNHIFGYFYSEPTHACDEDAGCAHSVHPITAKNISTQAEKRMSLQAALTPLHLWLLEYLQLSGVEPFIDFSRS